MAGFSELNKAGIVIATDYYPFGLEMRDRTLSAENHRFGFNGKEKDPSMGSLTHYDYGFRIYNPAIGRFLSVDPLTDLFPSQSSYLYAFNNPILYIDVEGLYGDENEANKQRDIAISNGLEVGDIYQSGDEWGFNVINGEDSYSAFEKNFSTTSNYGDTEVGILGSVLEAKKFDMYNSTQWKGINGKYYNIEAAPGKAKPFTGNQYAGSVKKVELNAKLVGRAGTILGIYSLFATDLEYRENINQGYGPNMTRHLHRRYKFDQGVNGIGFLGFWTSLVSLGYNGGQFLESICNCNIQYNPITKDFTPIEETLMMYDRLGVDLAPKN